MSRTRVVLALERPQRGAALRTALARDPSVVIVDEVADPVDLLLGVDLAEVDAVVHAWPGAGPVPGIYSNILAEYPDLTIIGIPAGGERAYVCRQEVVADEVLSPRLGDLLGSLRGPRPAVTGALHWSPGVRA